MALSARITPPHLMPGDSLVAHVTGASEFAGRRVDIEVWAADSIEVFWLATSGAEVDANGSAKVTISGVGVERETAVWVNAIASVGSRHRFEIVEPSVMDPSDLAANETTSTTMARLERERKQRFGRPIGDPNAEGAREHRLVYAIDRLLVTGELEFPGGVVRPLDSRPSGAEERRLLDRAVTLSGWHTSVPEENWSAHYGSAHPWTAITFQQIWAHDYAAADDLARPIRDDILGLLALNRGSKGRVVGVVIESREDADGVSSKVRFELPGYSGNLIGGAFADESQTTLLLQMLGVADDPLLKLAVDLYGEAISDSSADARYFRFWSILETLATSRVAAGLSVTLADGSSWPNGSTTTQAAPRVFRYLNDLGVADVGPALDLYTAVRAWYGRRNATAHRGRFDRADRGPATAAAFTFAALTPDTAIGGIDEWLDALKRTTKAVLFHELHRAGSGGL